MATTLSLANMVDLALGTPEVGAVNFNVLHTLLHAMLAKLDLTTYTIELSQADRRLLSSPTREAEIISKESKESKETKETKESKEAEKGKGTAAGAKRSSSPDRGKSSAPGGKQTPASSEKKQSTDRKQSQAADPVKSGSIDGSKEGGSREAKTPYHVLQSKVSALEEQMQKLNELPSNSELFERASPPDDKNRPTPVADMWQSVQLKNRVDANEEGIGKLMSLVEEMMTEVNNVKQSCTDMRDEINEAGVSSLRPDIDILKTDFQNLDIDALSELVSKMNKDFEELDIQSLRDLLDQMGKDFEGMKDQMNTFDDIQKKLTDLEELANNVNSGLSILPPAGNFDEFVTWNGLEHALKGLRGQGVATPKEGLETQTQWSRQPSSSSHQPTATSSQVATSPQSQLPPGTPGESAAAAATGTSDSPSIASTSGKEMAGLGRPTSGAQSSKLSLLDNSPSGPSDDLQDMLEGIGLLKARFDVLELRVDKLEEEMPLKADKTELATLLLGGSVGLPDELLAQLQNLKADLESLNKAKEKLAEMDQKFSNLPDFYSMQDSVSNLLENNENLTKIIETLRTENEMTFATMEDKLNSIQDLVMNTTVLPEYEGSPVGSRPESAAVTLPPISGATDDVGKLADLEMAMNRKDAEIHAIQQKIKWIMNDTSKQVANVKDKLADLQEELKKMNFREKASDSEMLKKTLDSKGISDATFPPVAPDDTEAADPSPSLTSFIPPSVPVGRVLPSSVGSSNLNSDNELQDSEALGRLQQIVQQLQAELDRVQRTASILTDANNSKTRQIEDLLYSSDKLQRIKADKEFVQTEMDVKADKRLLDSKVNRMLFDETTEELNNLIKELLDNLSGKEDAWKEALGSMTDNVEGKLDRLEFGPIRDELERRLRALARQLKELSVRDAYADDAAGFRKQLRFNCISCDRAVDVIPHDPVPSIPGGQAFPGSRSVRPYTTFELDQIRQQARRSRSRPQSRFRLNMTHFERNLTQQQLISYRMTGHSVLSSAEHARAMFDHDMQQPGVDVIDLYSNYRACGGVHTVIQPNRRVGRPTQFNNLFRDEEIVPPPTAREELDIEGADGHIYKGRIEARLPAGFQQGTQNGSSQRSQSPKTTRKLIYAQAVPRPPSIPSPTTSQSMAAAAPGVRPGSGRVIKPSPVAKKNSGPTASSSDHNRTQT